MLSVYIYVTLRGTPGTLGGSYRINYIKLLPFWGIFQEIRFGCAASEARHLVCQCNIIQQHYDIIHDVTVLHVH